MNFLQKAGQGAPSFFIYIIGALFGGVVAYQVIFRQPIDATALSLLYGVVTYAVNASGVKSGVDHTNDTVAKTAVAQVPLLQAQEARTAATETQVASNSARLAALEQPAPQETP